MSNWNVPLIGLPETSGAVTASSVGKALTTSYQAFETVTDYEWCGFTALIIYRTTGNETDVSIARGGSGAEYPIVNRLNLSNGGSTYGRGLNLHFPVRIPAGERVSMRLGTSFTTMYGYLIGHAAGAPGMVASAAFLERVGTAGTGVDLDAGGSANTKGSWVSLGSNSFNWKGFYLNATEDAGTSADFLVDIAIDIAGTKMIIAPDVPYVKGSSNTIGNNIVGPWFFDLPSGTNFYARCQCTSTSTTSRHLQMSLHGLV